MIISTSLQKRSANPVILIFSPKLSKKYSFDLIRVRAHIENFPFGKVKL